MSRQIGRPARQRRKRTGSRFAEAASASRAAAGFVSFVGAGPGDPDLITVRGRRALEDAELVFYDSLVDRRMLAGLPGRCVFVGKRCGRHSMTQEQINDLLVQSARAGRRVVRLKGGDPAVLGRVGEEALALAEHGIPFDIVPGVSSATAVPELAGIPVTHRGVADSFVVATAHRRCEEDELSIPPYSAGTTLVLLMARAKARTWTDDLRTAGYPDLLPVALVSSGCTPGQRVVVTSVANAMRDLTAAELATPVLAIIGRVVSLRSRLGGAERFEEFQIARGERLELDRPLAADFVGGTRGEEEERVVEFAS